jgi:hypothetical protein
MSRVGAQRAHDAKKPYRSGFCGRGNPKTSHDHCPAEYQGRPCVCDCHIVETIAAIYDVPVELLGEQPVGSAIPDDPTGFHLHLDEAVYHAHPTSLSVSGAKLILKAPALYKYTRENPVTSRAFDFGHAAHAMVLGVGAEIVVIERTVTDKAGEVVDTFPADDLKTTSAREHVEKIRAAGKIPMLLKDLAHVEAMAEELQKVTLIRDLMANGQPEVSAFCIDEPTRIMRRSRFDLLDDLLIDYKTTVCAEPGAFARSAATYGYHMQAAWYEQIALDLGRHVRGFLFIAQEKTPPYLTSVTELTADAVARGAELNRRALERFRDCTDTNLWPGYGDGITAIDLPRYAYYDQENES